MVELTLLRAIRAALFLDIVWPEFQRSQAQLPFIKHNVENEITSFHHISC